MTSSPCNYPLPSKTQVEQLWNQWGVLSNIRAHSRQVCRVALCLWQWLHERNHHFNREVIKAGALLHDVAKAYCLGKPELRHNLEGERILRESGYLELGELIARHVNLPVNYRLDESVIVFYADKRVVSDKVVSVEERFQYILRVYGQGELSRIQKIKSDAGLTHKVENEIFDLLPGRCPQDLSDIYN